MTWGFPGVSNFLGFTHALSRKLKSYAGLTLGGCAVVCHDHAVQAYQPAGWGDHVFALTRNPLTKEAKSPSFVEEGRMRMKVSLIIECEFGHHELDFHGIPDTDKAQIEHLSTWILNQALTQKLAGGDILSIGAVEYISAPQEKTRRLTMQLMPGYFLVDRQELLQQHHMARSAEDESASLFDSWLDFIALKHKASVKVTEDEVGEQSSAEWEILPKPAGGWLIPIAVGFKAISPVYAPGEVLRTRDTETPFRFVESIYSVGQWISPHRIRDLASVMWRYQRNNDWYFCKNEFSHSPLTEYSSTQGV